MNTLFALKLTLVPALIFGITAAGRRWGPAVAGWLSAFPVVAGPILFFISLEHGATFGAAAAAATLLGIVAHLSFGLAYAWLATRHAWPLCLSGALLVYGGVVALLNMLVVDLYQTAGAIFVLLIFARKFYPAASVQKSRPVAPANRCELPLRMVAGALLVVGVTYVAGSLGAKLSGLLAMFPVLGVVLAVFSQRQAGAAFTISLLRNMVLGYFSFVTFCALLAETLPRLGLIAGFAIATVAAVVVQAFTLRKTDPR